MDRKAVISARKSRDEGQLYSDRMRLHPDGEKKCSDCHDVKSISEFHQSLRTPDGLCYECKKCVIERMRRAIEKRRARTAEQVRLAAIGLRGSILEKKCSGCGTEKILDDFPINKLQTDGHHNICKVCMLIRTKIFGEKRQQLRNEARKGGCVVCGINDLRCLDLAHKNREDKLKNTNGNAIDPAHITSMQKLIAELKLVETKCATCHAQETHEERQMLRSEQKGLSQQNAERNRIPVDNEKLKRGECIDCKLKVNGNFWIFDFDHVRGNKIKNVSQMVVGGYTEDDIAKEMKKCDLRCRNCHRIVTHQRRVAEQNQ